MFEKKYANIVDFATDYKKGTFGLYVATLTERKQNKHPTGTPRSLQKSARVNPYMGRVFNLTIHQNAASGKNYYNIVEAECKRCGIFFTEEEFKKAFPKEETYTEEISEATANIIIQKKDSEQKYLRLYDGNAVTKVKNFVILDGKVCEDKAILDDIKIFDQARKPSQKQLSLGLTNIVGVKNYKIENVIFIGQKDKIYINERFSAIENIDLSNIKKLFE